MIGDSAGAWSLLLQAHASGQRFAGFELAARAGLRGENPARLRAGVDREQDGRDFLDAALHTPFVIGAHPARAIALADSFAALAAGLRYPRNLRVSALLTRASIRVGQGRFIQAWNALREADSIEAESQRVLRNIVIYGINTGAHRDSIRAVAGKLVLNPLSSLDDQLAVATYAAETGDSSLLAESLNRVGALTVSQQPGDQADRLRILGFAALAAGVNAHARQLFDSATRRAGPGTRTHIDLRASLALARIELTAGAAPAAERALYRPDRTLGPFGMPLSPLTYRATFEELRGQIAEVRGDTAAAIQSYATFIELWKDCDPELQPRVAAARAALRRLQRP
jgi:hypothetical protein